ncbi:MAG TPA: polysaccharide deacetylase family protein [Ferruginibacter sp.]|nr:polysaccharide deacetylase family protein [Ferruginibacter sp.]HRE64641.1 polysaccharide deacetylase family protein [Ferruginibacter sp.]
MILQTLQKQKIKASFFFTGRYYNNPNFANSIKKIKKNGHYLGAHSNDHLLYAAWEKRDSLLLSQVQFNEDLQKNYEAMKKFGIIKKDALYFLPPFEWYNDTIASWTHQQGLQLINYSPGTISHADYTWPELKNYKSSEDILASIRKYATNSKQGLNGFILLIHIGVDPKRTDKLYNYLPQLIQWLQQKGYHAKRVDELLK